MQPASLQDPDPGNKPKIQLRILGHKEPAWLRETINMMIQDIRPVTWPSTITFAFAEHACPIESIPRSLCHIHNDPGDERYYVQLCFAPGIMHAPPPPIWNDEQPTEAIINLLAKTAGQPPYADCEQQIKEAEQRVRKRFMKTIRHPLTAYEAAMLAAQGARALWPDTP